MIASRMKTNRTLMTLIFMIYADWICEDQLNLCHLRSMIDLKATYDITILNQ